MWRVGSLGVVGYLHTSRVDAKHLWQSSFQGLVALMAALNLQGRGRRALGFGAREQQQGSPFPHVVPQGVGWGWVGSGPPSALGTVLVPPLP